MNAAAESQITIRDIEAIGEMRVVEELQNEIWGIPDLDVVPVYHLAAAVASGGVLLGAFDADEMVGFAYGFVGHERGITVHHSHMLAVKSEYRSHDIGYKLKHEQRRRVLAADLTLRRLPGVRSVGVDNHSDGASVILVRADGTSNFHASAIRTLNDLWIIRINTRQASLEDAYIALMSPAQGTGIGTQTSPVRPL